MIVVPLEFFSLDLVDRERERNCKLFLIMHMIRSVLVFRNLCPKDVCKFDSHEKLNAPWCRQMDRDTRTDQRVQKLTDPVRACARCEMGCGYVRVRMSWRHGSVVLVYSFALFAFAAPLMA